MSRINRNVYKRISSLYLNDIDNLWITNSKVYRVYKFRKTSGILRLTPSGEKSLNFDASNFSQIVNLYSGKEPVVVVWNNSTNLSVNDNDKIVKNIQVGDYYEMYGIAPMSVSNQSDTITFLSNEFTTQFLSKDITLQSKEWIPTDDDILDYVYMIIDHRAKSYQWLEIESFTPNYNEESEKLENVEITFNNINLKYASSGKSILDFFQFGSMGEGYAFPVEKIETDVEGNKKIVVGYDEILLVDVGTDQIQLDFSSGAALSSIHIEGRKTSQKLPDGTIIVDKPHRLFLFKSEFPLSSPIFFNQPNSNCFWYENASPSMSGVWESYKEKASANDWTGNYNVGKSKTTLGGIQMNQEHVRASNPIVNNSYAFINWKNDNFIGLKNTYNFEALNEIQSANMSTSLLSMCDFLNFNSYVNFSSDVFNYEITETTKYKLSDTLGVLGGIVEKLVGGIDLGWTKIESLAPSQPMNLLFPTISYNMGMIGIANATALPFDVFIDDKDETMIPIPLNVLTAYRFSLTDRIVDSSQVRKNVVAGKGGNGIWNLIYLGQTQFEDGTWINSDHSPFKFNPATTKATTPSPNTKFIVDYIGFHAIGQCDVRLTGLTTYEDGKVEQNYYALFETMSKARKDIRIWGNSMKLNFYENFNTTGKIKWPQVILAPAPDSKYRTILADNIIGDIINTKALIDYQTPVPKIIKAEGNDITFGLNATYTNRNFLSVDDFRPKWEFLSTTITFDWNSWNSINFILQLGNTNIPFIIDLNSTYEQVDPNTRKYPIQVNNDELDLIGTIRVAAELDLKIGIHTTIYLFNWNVKVYSSPVNGTGYLQVKLNQTLNKFECTFAPNLIKSATTLQETQQKDAITWPFPASESTLALRSFSTPSNFLPTSITLLNIELISK